MKGLFSWLSGSKGNGKPPQPIRELLETENSTAVLIELGNRSWPKVHAGGFDDLSEPEMVIHLLYDLESEVNNGGFHQYFWNSSGNLANLAPWALEQIGAPKTSKLVMEALSIFPQGKTIPDWEKRQEYLDERGDEAFSKLNPLDNQFYKYEESLEELQIEYIRRNIIDFESSE